MRKLKLQVQMTLDGFVAGPNGELDWMVNDQDESFSETITDPANSSDIILMGRKMTPEFIDYWENVLDNEPENPEHPLAQRMVSMRKIVFSRTQTAMKGRNLEVENGDLADTVQRLKSQQGKDLIAYGGATFARSLISLNLVDEYYIFRNPVAIGNGLSIFTRHKRLRLVSSIPLNNGTVFNKYLTVDG
jgi:dihydrofolate reductase